MKSKMFCLAESTKKIVHDLRTDRGSEIAWTGLPGEVRTPEEREKSCGYPGLFQAAGRVYTSWKGLCVKQGDRENLFYDVYGREVFVYKERFPCFDSYDYIYENRYYRWFFLKEDGKLTRVYYTDSRPQIEITEDVRYVENICLDRMLELGWVEKTE